MIKLIFQISLSIVCLFQMTSLEKCKIDAMTKKGPGLETSIKLQGNTDCNYGSEDCNPCINGVLEQIEALATERRESSIYRFQNGDLGLSMNILKHPQGIARLPGVKGENWLLITRNHFKQEEKAGVISINFPKVESLGEAWSNKNELDQEGHMKHFYSSFDNKHPGGCQLIGHHLAVAHEAVLDGIPEPTWISFYDVSDPMKINEGNRFCFDGIDALGESYFMSDKGQAICVGISQLSNGHYLMLALESRRRLPSDVAWFFTSTTKDLKTTQWKFIQFWHQDELLPNKNAFRTYENINLVTDCNDGAIYMLGFYGKGKSNAIDVFSLTKNDQNKMILEKIYEKKVKTRVGGASFRAGASLHITPKNKAVLYCVEKSDSGHWMTVEEFKQRENYEKNTPTVVLPAN